MNDSLRFSWFKRDPTYKGKINSASGPSDVGALLQKVTGCLTAVADWMSANRLQLNSDKTELMWLTSPRSQHRLPTSGS